MTTNYSKVGCLQCKKAHQKCDEKVPKCDRCLRKSLNCKYFSNFIIEDIKSSAGRGKAGKKSQRRDQRCKTKFSGYVPVYEKGKRKEYSKEKSKPVVTLDGLGVQNPLVSKKNNQFKTNNDREFVSEKPLLEKTDKASSGSTSLSTGSNSLLHLMSNGLDSSIIHPSPLGLDNIDSKNNMNPNESFLCGNNKANGINDEPTSLDSPYNCINNLDDASDINDSSVHHNGNSLGNFEHQSQHDEIENTNKHSTVLENKSYEVSVNSKKGEFADINHITLEDLVQVMPTDIDFLNMIEMNCEDFYSLKDNYVPHTSAFEVSWKNSVTVDFLGIFQQYDPIQSIYAERGYVSLKDVRMLNFIWTLNKGTRHYFNFPMYPLEIYNEVLEHCAKLNSIYPIIQSVMTYDCAMLLTGIYKRSNKNELFSLWDRQIRIPSFKQCLDILKARVDTTTSFSESVVLTFAVIIIFSANSSDDSWRTHLKGSYQLVLKSSFLQSSIDPNNEIDFAASKIFEIVKEWFFNTDFLSHVSSNNGFQIDKNVSLKYNRDPETSLAILDNGLSLIGGHSLELKPFFLKIQTVLSEFDSRGVRLCGNNFLVFKFTNTDKTLAAEVKSIGFELLMQLKELKYQYKRSKIHDYQMEFTLKNSDRLSRLALELYLAYFFIGNKPIEYYVELLEEILEVIYSIPYYSTACIYCQWSIYLSALVALLHKKDELYQCFYNVLYSLRQNGMYVTENSLNRLAHIKSVTESKQYDQLLDPVMDFMLI